MSFPVDQDLEVTARAAFGADLTADPSTWVFTDLSDRVIDTPITISHGVVTGAGTAKSGSVTGLTLLNDDGALTPFLATSEWFPYVDAGTPFDLNIRTNTSPYISDTFTRIVASGWGTATSGQPWLNTTGLATNGTAGTITFAAVNAARGAQMLYTHRDIDVTFEASIPVVSTGQANLIGPQLRMSAANDAYVWPLLELGLSGAVALSVWTLESASFVRPAIATVSGLTYTAGARVKCRFQLIGDTIKGKAWLPANPEPTDWHVETTITVRQSADAYLGMAAWVQAGNTNTMPLAFTVDNVTFEQPKYPRYEGYITDVQPAFRPIGDGTFHSVVRVKLGGVSTRLEKRLAADLSPLRRSLEKASPPPIAYWPLEDKSGATSGASAYPSQPPMIVTGPAVFAFDLGATDDALVSRYGSTAVCSLAAGAKLASSVPATTSTSWTVALQQQTDATNVGGGITEMRIAEWATPSGTFQRWALIGVASGGYQVRAYNDAAGTVTNVVTFAAASYGAYFAHFSVDAAQSGGNINVEFRVNNVVLASGSVAGTSAPLTRLVINPDQVNTTNSTSPSGIKFLVGHVTVSDFAGSVLPNYFDFSAPGAQPTRADRAWAYEAAHRRAARLAGEERVPFTLVGDPYTTGITQLNAQQPGAFQNLITQVGESGSGTLILESGFGYSYRERTDRYNAAVDLTIDMATFCRSTGIDPTEVLVPKLDARGPNIWTVQRTNGSSATVAADSTYLLRRGEVTEQAVLDILYDADAAEHASWRVHLNVDGQGANYPNMPLDLAANPGLIDDWLLCRVGSRIQRLNQPTIAGLGVIDQVIDGITETIGATHSGRSWTVTLDTSPAAVWQTGAYDDGSRYDSASTTMAVAASSTATQLVLWTDNPDDQWSSDDVPYPIMCAGQENTVLWMSGPDSSCTIDGGFELGVAGWSTVGATLAASTAFAHKGTGSARLTVTGSPSIAYIYPTITWAAPAGYTWTASAWMYSATGVSNARITISWYTGAGTFITSSSSSTISLPAGVWTQVTVTAAAPPTSVQAFVLPSLTSSPANGTVFYVDDVDLVPVASGPIVQRCTVTRGTNGVTKALPVDEQVHIANPSYWAL